ncbi:MAG: NADPH:quinone oxidoreductase family protein, partial [Candidatus Solibacter usitatus]|nr:NADPH:quinone oxidoreductase family protein [Candidatus Solibacter usitatus]
KAWLVRASCEPEEMRMEEIDLPQPGKGQVRIRNYAAGVNFADLLLVQGKYQSARPFPFIPGAELAGVVDAVGEGVEGLAAGTRVMAMTDLGTFAEYSLAHAARVLEIPDALGFDEAASVIAYHTSYYALDRARLAAGECLLVHAGASGVGMTAIQMGKALGATVIATASSAEKLEYCRAQGADHAISYTAANWVEEVKKITPRGVNVIYDPVGGDVFDLCTKCIAPQGRILVIGFASGRIPSIQVNRLLLKNCDVIGIWWGSYVEKNAAYFRATHAALMEWFQSGKICPAVSKTFCFENAPQALREMASRKTLGKTAVVI